MAINDTGLFVVNILAAGQDEISERFSLPAYDKFEGVSYHSGIGSIPVLDDALVNLECRIENSFDGGDHSIFVGAVESVSFTDGNPLVYFHGNYRDLLSS